MIDINALEMDLIIIAELATDMDEVLEDDKITIPEWVVFLVLN